MQYTLPLLILLAQADKNRPMPNPNSSQAKTCPAFQRSTAKFCASSQKRNLSATVSSDKGVVQMESRGDQLRRDDSRGNAWSDEIPLKRKKEKERELNDSIRETRYKELHFRSLPNKITLYYAP